MQPQFVSSTTMGSAWLACLKAVMEAGTTVMDGPEELREIMSLTVQIEEPERGDSIMSAAQCWDDALSLYRAESADHASSLGVNLFDYTSRIRDYPSKDGSIDQLDWVRARLSRNPDAKSATAVMIKPGEDDNRLPCLVALDFKIREHRLVTQAFFRSQDVWNKQPYNLVLLRSFASQLATALQTAVGPLVLYVASAHVYGADIDDAARFRSDAKKSLVQSEVSE